ncbi:MAG: hypothetical protein EXQ52_03560 [Bryobacterales bacterium]|nr:hypothetical protein [Bryobacterales bacterium]
MTILIIHPPLRFQAQMTDGSMEIGNARGRIGSVVAVETSEYSPFSSQYTSTARLNWLSKTRLSFWQIF